MYHLVRSNPLVRLTTLGFLSFSFAMPCLASEIIIDNGGAGTSYTGSWKDVRGKDAFAGTAAESKATGASYRYSTALPSAGEYEVYLWWTAAGNRSSAAPVEVTHSLGTTQLTIDQQVNGGQWKKIGVWDFAASGDVTLRSVGGRTTTSADAVKFVPFVASLPPAPAPAPEPVLGSALLTWQSPTTNSDGTPLVDLAGFVVYASTVSGQYTVNDIVGKVPAFSPTGGVWESYEVAELKPGTYYFAVTAYNNAGAESGRSEEVAKTIGTP